MSGSSLSTVSVFHTPAEILMPVAATSERTVTRPMAARCTRKGLTGSTADMKPVITLPIEKSAATYASHPTTNPERSPNAARA